MKENNPIDNKTEFKSRLIRFIITAIIIQVFTVISALLGLVPAALIGFILTLVILIIEMAVIFLIYGRFDLLVVISPIAIVTAVISSCCGMGLGGLIDVLKAFAGLGIFASIGLFALITEICGWAAYLGARFGKLSKDGRSIEI